MSIQGRSDRANPRHLEAELVSHLRVIDEGIATLGYGMFSPVALGDVRRALAGVRGTGVMLGNNGLVTVASVLAESLTLVTEQPVIPADAAMQHLRAIATALRSIVITQPVAGDPRPQLTATWASFQTLQELRAAAVRNAGAGRANFGGFMHENAFVSDPSRAFSMADTFVAECAHHIGLIRLAADDISCRAPARDGLRAVLRSLHALKGAAAVAGFPAIQESCHRSEERIQRLASSGPGVVPTLVAEIRLATDSIDELLEEIRRCRRSATNSSVVSEPNAGYLCDVHAVIARVRSMCDVLDARADRSNESERAELVREITLAYETFERIGVTHDQRPMNPTEDPIGTDAVAILAARLQSAFAVMAEDAGKQGVLELHGLRGEMSADLAAALYDPLLQILRNSIDHGIESTHERTANGKPERATVIVRSFRRGNETIVEVFDDGAGIHIDQVRKQANAQGLGDVSSQDEHAILRIIFEPGFTLRDTADTRSGRGIGLDIVRTAAEELGGEVAVASTPGIGTCFRLTFPDRTPEAVKAALRREDALTRDDARARTALVVDDSVGVRRVLGRTLQRHGWRTVQARDGAEALQVMRAELPDILVTDIEMSAFDGVALVRAVREHAAWAELPIVVMTSRTSETRNDSLRALGADACLAKPFDEPDLLAALELATGRRPNYTAA